MNAPPPPERVTTAQPGVATAAGSGHVRLGGSVLADDDAPGTASPSSGHQPDAYQSAFSSSATAAPGLNDGGGDEDDDNYNASGGDLVTSGSVHELPKPRPQRLRSLLNVTALSTRRVQTVSMTKRPLKISLSLAQMEHIKKIFEVFDFVRIRGEDRAFAKTARKVIDGKSKPAKDGSRPGTGIDNNSRPNTSATAVGNNARRRLGSGEDDDDSDEASDGDDNRRRRETDNGSECSDFSLLAPLASRDAMDVTAQRNIIFGLGPAERTDTTAQEASGGTAISSTDSMPKLTMLRNVTRASAPLPPVAAAAKQGESSRTTALSSGSAPAAPSPEEEALAALEQLRKCQSVVYGEVRRMEEWRREQALIASSVARSSGGGGGGGGTAAIAVSSGKPTGHDTTGVVVQTSNGVPLEYFMYFVVAPFFTSFYPLPSDRWRTVATTTRKSAGSPLSSVASSTAAPGATAASASASPPMTPEEEEDGVTAAAAAADAVLASGLYPPPVLTQGVFFPTKSSHVRAAQRLFRSMDTNGDGLVAWDEFSQFVLQDGQRQILELEQREYKMTSNSAAAAAGDTGSSGKAEKSVIDEAAAEAAAALDGASGGGGIGSQVTSSMQHGLEFTPEPTNVSGWQETYPMVKHLFHRDAIHRLVYSRLNNHYFTASADGLVKMWRADPRLPDAEQRPSIAHERNLLSLPCPISDMTLSPASVGDAEVIAVAAMDGTVTFMRTSTGETVRTMMGIRNTSEAEVAVLSDAHNNAGIDHEKKEFEEDDLLSLRKRKKGTAGTVVRSPYTIRAYYDDTTEIFFGKANKYFQGLDVMAPTYEHLKRPVAFSSDVLCGFGAEKLLALHNSAHGLRTNAGTTNHCWFATSVALAYYRPIVIPDQRRRRVDRFQRSLRRSNVPVVGVHLLVGFEAGVFQMYTMNDGWFASDQINMTRLEPACLRQPARSLILHTASITSIRVLEPSDMLVTASDDGTIGIRVFARVEVPFMKLGTGVVDRALFGDFLGGGAGAAGLAETHAGSQNGHVKKITCLIWNAERSMLVSGGMDYCVCFWSPHTSRPTRTVDLREMQRAHVALSRMGACGYPIDMCFMDRGAREPLRLVVLDSRRVIKILHALNGSFLTVLSDTSAASLERGELLVVRYDAAEERLLLGGKYIRCWNVVRNGSYAKDYAGHRRPVLFAQWHHAMRVLVTADSENIVMWQLVFGPNTLALQRRAQYHQARRRAKLAAQNERQKQMALQMLESKKKREQDEKEGRVSEAAAAAAGDGGSPPPVAPWPPRGSVAAGDDGASDGAAVSPLHEATETPVILFPSFSLEGGEGGESGGGGGVGRTISNKLTFDDADNDDGVDANDPNDDPYIYTLSAQNDINVFNHTYYNAYSRMARQWDVPEGVRAVSIDPYSLTSGVFVALATVDAIVQYNSFNGSPLRRFGFPSSALDIFSLFVGDAVLNKLENLKVPLLCAVYEESSKSGITSLYPLRYADEQELLKKQREEQRAAQIAREEAAKKRSGPGETGDAADGAVSSDNDDENAAAAMMAIPPHRTLVSRDSPVTSVTFVASLGVIVIGGTGNVAVTPIIEFTSFAIPCRRLTDLPLPHGANNSTAGGTSSNSFNSTLPGRGTGNTSDGSVHSPIAAAASAAADSDLSGTMRGRQQAPPQRRPSFRRKTSFQGIGRTAEKPKRPPPLNLAALFPGRLVPLVSEEDSALAGGGAAKRFRSASATVSGGHHIPADSGGDGTDPDNSPRDKQQQQSQSQSQGGAGGNPKLEAEARMLEDAARSGEGYVTCLCPLHHTGYVLSGNSDGLLQLWNVRTSSEVLRFQGTLGSEMVTSIGIVPYTGGGRGGGQDLGEGSLSLSAAAASRATAARGGAGSPNNSSSSESLSLWSHHTEDFYLAVGDRAGYVLLLDFNDVPLLGETFLDMLDAGWERQIRVLDRWRAHANNVTGLQFIADPEHSGEGKVGKPFLEYAQRPSLFGGHGALTAPAFTRPFFVVSSGEDTSVLVWRWQSGYLSCLGCFGGGPLTAVDPPVLQSSQHCIAVYETARRLYVVRRLVQEAALVTAATSLSAQADGLLEFMEEEVRRLCAHDRDWVLATWGSMVDDDTLAEEDLEKRAKLREKAWRKRNERGALSLFDHSGYSGAFLPSVSLQQLFSNALSEYSQSVSRSTSVSASSAWTAANGGGGGESMSLGRSYDATLRETKRTSLPFSRAGGPDTGLTGSSCYVFAFMQGYYTDVTARACLIRTLEAVKPIIKKQVRRRDRTMGGGAGGLSTRAGSVSNISVTTPAEGASPASPQPPSSVSRGRDGSGCETATSPSGDANRVSAVHVSEPAAADSPTMRQRPTTATPADTTPAVADGKSPVVAAPLSAPPAGRLTMLSPVDVAAGVGADATNIPSPAQEPPLAFHLRGTAGIPTFKVAYEESTPMVVRHDLTEADIKRSEEEYMRSLARRGGGGGEADYYDSDEEDEDEDPHVRATSRRLPKIISAAYRMQAAKAHAQQVFATRRVSTVNLNRSGADEDEPEAPQESVSAVIQQAYMGRRRDDAIAKLEERMRQEEMEARMQEKKGEKKLKLEAGVVGLATYADFGATGTNEVFFGNEKVLFETIQYDKRSKVVQGLLQELPSLQKKKPGAAETESEEDGDDDEDADLDWYTKRDRMKRQRKKDDALWSPSAIMLTLMDWESPIVPEEVLEQRRKSAAMLPPPGEAQDSSNNRSIHPGGDGAHAAKTMGLKHSARIEAARRMQEEMESVNVSTAGDDDDDDGGEAPPNAGAEGGGGGRTSVSWSSQVAVKKKQPGETTPGRAALPSSAVDNPLALSDRSDGAVRLALPSLLPRSFTARAPGAATAAPAAATPFPSLHPHAGGASSVGSNHSSFRGGDAAATATARLMNALELDVTSQSHSDYFGGNSEDDSLDHHDGGGARDGPTDEEQRARVQDALRTKPPTILKTLNREVEEMKRRAREAAAEREELTAQYNRNKRAAAAAAAEAAASAASATSGDLSPKRRRSSAGTARGTNNTNNSSARGGSGASPRPSDAGAATTTNNNGDSISAGTPKAAPLTAGKSSGSKAATPPAKSAAAGKMASTAPGRLLPRIGPAGKVEGTSARTQKLSDLRKKPNYAPTVTLQPAAAASAKARAGEGGGDQGTESNKKKSLLNPMVSPRVTSTFFVA